MAPRKVPKNTKKLESILIKAEEQASAEKAAREAHTKVEEDGNDREENLRQSKNHKAKAESDSDSSGGSESSSSSSEEDSDDDFEVELGIAKKNKNTPTSSSSESEDEEVFNKRFLDEFEQKMKSTMKKKRVLQKAHKASKGIISDEEDLICDYESKKIQQTRKRRMYRRKIMRGPGVVKRRRIKRTTVDVTEDYNCETFLEFGTTTTNLTAPIDKNDMEVDHTALKKVFAELGIPDSAGSDDGLSEEDETDIIANKLKFYHARNCRERIDQLNNLPVNSFSEKLIGYTSTKALHGSSSSSIQNYHPDMLRDEKSSRIPQAVIWNRPFTHLIYQKAVFDPHQEANDFLRKMEQEAKEQRRKVLLEEIYQSVREKTAAKNFSQPENQYEDPMYIFENEEPIDQKCPDLYSHIFNEPSTSEQPQNDDEDDDLFAFQREIEEEEVEQNGYGTFMSGGGGF